MKEIILEVHYSSFWKYITAHLNMQSRPMCQVCQSFSHYSFGHLRKYRVTLYFSDANLCPMETFGCP